MPEAGQRRVVARGQRAPPRGRRPGLSFRAPQRDEGCRGRRLAHAGGRGPRSCAGSHTTRSGMSVISTGTVTAPRLGGHGYLAAGRHCPPRPRSRRTSGRPVPGPCPPGSARRPACDRRRADYARWPAPPDRAWADSAVAAVLAATAGLAAAAGRRGQRGDLAAGRGGVGQAQVHVHLIGQRGQDLEVGTDRRDGQRRAERARAAFPVNERARLLGHRGDREHDVGPVGDRADPQLQADHEAGRRQRGQRGIRVGQVGGVHAGDQQGRQLAADGGGQDRRRCPGRARPAASRRPRSARPRRGRQRR